MRAKVEVENWPACPESNTWFVEHRTAFGRLHINKSTMKSELTEEAASKSPGRAAKSIPEGMHSITPHIVCAGAAEAIEFYKKAFGAVEISRLPGDGGKLMHAEIRIGDSVVMLVDESPEWGMIGPKSLKGSPVTIHLYVDDVDAVVQQAVQAGAKVTVPVEDMFWGDRYGKLEDPFGHQWSVATHLRDVTPEEINQAMTQMCG
jgi:PhnB protein